MSKFLLAAVSFLAITILPLSAETSLGEQLETQMWENMLHRNFTDVEKSIAPEFQSVHTFGALSRQGEIELIKNLYLGSYKISDVKVTESADTIIVTYLISVQEKIENKNLSAKPAPRLSVWQKINNKWMWIAHANLKEVPVNKPTQEVPEKPAESVEKR